MKATADRPEYDVGAILRRWGSDYSRTHPMPGRQRRVMQTLSTCRTAALGGHLETCDRCGHERPVYNSCGDRHCPTCQGKLARKWLSERMQDVLNVPYFHCIFTIPDTFNVLVPCNERRIYSLLFRAVSQTLKAFARKQLGGELAIVAVLHTWGQTLWLHPHIHCIVSGGALSFDRKRWIGTGSKYLFDVLKLSADFRKRFCRMLRRTELRFTGEAACYVDPALFEAFIAGQEARDWVVYTKKPETGPSQILEYISRYSHRVAISNRRIRDISDNGVVTLEYKDYRDTDAQGRPQTKDMPLQATEFIGRFMRHVLPRGFRKIRFYGLLAGHDKKDKLAAVRALLGPVEPRADVEETSPSPEPEVCPHCGEGVMHPGPALLPQRAPPVVFPCTQSSKIRAA